MTWGKGWMARASIRSPRVALSGVATVVALVGLVGVAPARAETGNVLRWQQLGHIGDQPVQWIAVPPDGLASGVLFARIADAHGQNVATRRSRDGGKTWDTVPDPPGRIALAPGGSPVFSLGNDAVYRSTDTGATWTAVVPVQGAELSFSPAFQQDATVFLRGGDRLWRSMDGGGTWSNRDPGQGQVITVARVSPNFPVDQTIFAGSVGADNTDSLGVLISQDRGTTWAPVSGLQADSDPYQYVTDIEMSPDYAQDRTLFAVAHGPQGLPSSRDTAAVFVSQDGGATWTVSRQTTSGFSSELVETLMLSPNFAADQTVLESNQRSGTAPSLSGCGTALSTDAGSTWSELALPTRQTGGPSNGLMLTTDPGLPATGVCGVGVLSANGTTVLLARTLPYYLTGGGVTKLARSLDSGAAWIPLYPPGSYLYGYSPSGMALLPDAVLAGTSQGDLWEYAAFPPCAIQPSLGFGEVWTQHPELQELSGCPLGPEQPVTVQRRHVVEPQSTYDLYWAATPNGPCFRVWDDDQGGLTGGPFDPSLAKALGESLPQECSGTGDTSLSGSLLSFAGGQSWLYVSDSPGHGFVVTTFPDAPVIRF